jgi:hypothetical protein
MSDQGSGEDESGPHWVVHEIAAHSDVGALDFIFLWAFGEQELGIGGKATFGDVGDGYETESVSTFDVMDALGESAKFVGCRGGPNLVGFWIGNEGSVFHGNTSSGVNDGVGVGYEGIVEGGCGDETVGER